MAGLRTRLANAFLQLTRTERFNSEAASLRRPGCGSGMVIRRC